MQVSNDYYLGNIQKDGSYSVVPRMAGGEVTPDGLIAIGQIAKNITCTLKLLAVNALTCLVRKFTSFHSFGKS